MGWQPQPLPDLEMVSAPIQKPRALIPAPPPSPEPPAPAPPADTGDDRGYFEEFTDAFQHSLAPGTLEMYGSAVEAAGVLMGEDQAATNVRSMGTEMQATARGMDVGKAPSVQSWAQVKDADSALRLLFGGAGSGLGSTVPSLISGTLGGLLGARLRGRTGATIGSIAGAAIPAMPLNMGEAFAQFKSEGVDPGIAAASAMAITPAITALDAAGLFTSVGGVPAAVFKRAIIGRVARGIAKGFVAEGGTEGVQSLLREATAGFLTGNPDALNRGMRILDETTIGAMTGGVLGAGGGLRTDGASEAGGEASPNVQPQADPTTPPPADTPIESPPPVSEPTTSPPSEGIVSSTQPIDEGALRRALEEPTEQAVGALPRPIGMKSGGPYRSRRAAQLGTRGRGLEGHAPVEIGGGWGLAPSEIANLYPPAQGVSSPSSVLGLDPLGPPTLNAEFPRILPDAKPGLEVRFPEDGRCEAGARGSVSQDLADAKPGLEVQFPRIWQMRSRGLRFSFPGSGRCEAGA